MPMTSHTAATQASFPFLDLKAQYRSIKADIDAAIQRVMDSQQFILGSEVEALEAEVAAFCISPFAIGCASGSDALLLPLMALDVLPDDEVVTTPFTFVATAGSIARLGARPVFVDIDPATFNLDPKKLDAAIGAHTRAIIPVHLFGMSADMDAIMEVAARRGVPVIEDAAQALGAEFGGRRVGTIGLCGAFSFFPSKNLGGAGDGGMLTTHDANFAQRLRVLRNHGSNRSKYEYDVIGMNSRLDALQAAILRVKLHHLDSWAAARQANAARYEALFRGHGLTGTVTLPAVSPRCSHVYNQYVIGAPHRDKLRSHMQACGVPTDVYYPIPLHLQKAFAYLNYRPGAFPHAERAAGEVLALPIFPEITADQQAQVAEAIKSFYC